MQNLIGFILLITLPGCTFRFEWWNQFRAQRAISQQDYDTALRLLQRVIVDPVNDEVALNAARQGARVAHLFAKKYPQAIEFYRYLILRSKDEGERKMAQNSIAQIYYENLLDYNQAVLEYERLLKHTDNPDEKFRFRLNIAKSHFQLNSIAQALNEIDFLLSQPLDPGEAFEAYMLKANVYLANRQQSDAANIWEKIIREFPERSKKENVALNLVVAYEEMKKFDKAIEVLQRMQTDYANPEFLTQKIERLRERQANLPGARGWKK